MKRMMLMMSVAASLAAAPLTASAHGGFGFCLWPLWPLSVGLGFSLGCASTYHASCPDYGYCYRSSVYAYTPPTVYTTPAIPVASAPVEAPAPVTPVWVPSTPGAGHWVPDPTPYSYSENAAPKPRVATTPSTPPSVTVTHSPGNVKVYVVTYPNR